ncbi:nucleobase:cation symporter-2 family protein [Megasphaera cerevisiae]|uniref:nucleobase:cation symporter-2 family protein n=1 Tax=Megasphaera cerevisiae TaxID=39029 RepID=UPI000944E119|nr:nucleobase:cation symporter-2 family protein [Megasphaera cerevisiae]OKY53700.1 uracil permease [Megasphaera cerevisiae]
MSENRTAKSIHPVDEILPFSKLFAYGLQHVLAMYAGAVAVPIIVAQAMHLTPDQLIHLINADLFTCGIATLIQTLGFWRVGARIPMIQGVTFASVTPMILIGTEHGITAIYGAIILAGLFTFFIAPWFSRLIRFFPPVVTGTIITIIGITLLPVSVRWIGGGGSPSSPDFANPMHLFLAFITLGIVILVYRYGKGFVSNIAVLIGLICGTVIAMVLGQTDFAEVGRSEWFGIITPFSFGFPTFDVGSVISMIIVMLVVMVETTGDCIAIGEIVGKPIGRKNLARCLRADGLSTFIGGIFNSFPYTAFAQNVGLIAVTRVKSRFVVAGSGIILIALGLFPKMAAVVACIPNSVLGGAGLAMFGMIIASGIRALSKVDFEGNYNLMLVAVSIGISMITLTVPTFFQNFPDAAKIILQSGITLGSLTAVVLNLILNGVGEEAAVEEE